MPPHQTPDPSLLISRARDGSDAAFNALVEMYGSYLHLLARIRIPVRLRGKLGASDVVQESFLRAHDGLDDFRGSSEQELVCWLRRILAHTLANQIRRYEGTAKRAAHLELSLHDALDRSAEHLASAIPDPISSPSQQAVRREEAVLVADALERLPEHYREVIVLRNLEGLSFPDVARRMNRSLSSVKCLWPRALEALQREVAEHGP